MTATALWSAETEVDVLATVLYAPERCEIAFERLTADHFHDPVHARVWGVISTLRYQGAMLDPHAVSHRIGNDEAFGAWGGAHKLIDIMEKGSPPAIQSMTGVLCDLHTRRSVEALARDVIDRVRQTGEGTGEAILVDLEREAAGIAQQTSFESAWASAGDMMARAIEAARQRDGRITFPVGLHDVDQKLGGLNAGETTVVAAWTGMGKTIAGLQIAKGCGSAGIGVAYFSLEMAEAPMAMRLGCDIAFNRSAPAYWNVTSNITIDRALKGDLTREQMDRLIEAQGIAADWPIFFDTRPNLSVAQIQAATVRLHRQWAKCGIRPGPVIIDHIGKVKPSTDRRGNVTAETRDVANDLDAMAKKLNVPVVALSQLNRNVETGASKDKRPTLSSVKDSGAVVENARQVIFIYRPEYYYREPFEHEDAEAKADRLDELRKVENHFYWLIEKNSNGPRAQVLTYCKADCSAVRDWNP